MIDCLDTRALRRCHKGIFSAALALGALIAPAPGFAQGPPLPKVDVKALYDNSLLKSIETELGRDKPR